MNIYVILPFISFWLLLILGINIFILDKNNPVNKLFSLLCMFMAVYAFAEFMYRPAESLEIAKFWIKVAGMWVFCPPLLLHLALIFTKKNKILINKLIYIVLYVPAATIFIMGGLYNFYIGEPVKKYWGYTYSLPRESTPFCVGTSWNILLVFVALGLVLSYSLKTKTIYKKRMSQYLFISIIFLVISGIFTEILPHLMHTEIPELNTAIMTLFALVVGHGLIRHRLFFLEPIKVPENILAAMNHALFALSPKGRIAVANNAASSLLLYEKTELLDMHIDRVFTDTRALQKIKSPSNTKLAVLDAEARRKDGTHILLTISKSEVSDSKGNLLGTILIASDESEKKKIEEYLINEQRIESLGLLAGGIAHDFNNILNILFGYCELIREALPPGQSEISGYLDNIFSSYKRALNLTSQLLTFAKGGTPKLKKTDMAVFIKETAKAALSNSDKCLSVKISSDLWKCDIDKIQARQAIYGILINAEQGLAENGLIKLTAVNLSEGSAIPSFLQPNKYVKISIRDDNSSITEEDIKKIFDPYYSIKKAGTLGLATAYSIIIKHNGYIEAESLKGKGKTIHVYLPASLNQEITADNVEIKAHSGHGYVLLMDDETMNLKILSQMLERKGYKIKYTLNGEEAVYEYKKALNENTPYDLVFLDLMIPIGMGGLETIKKLKELNPDVKAVAASGYSDDPVMSLPAQYGFIGSLSKPYLNKDLDELLNSIFPDNK